MSFSNVSVVMVHGAWADGSSWSKVINRLRDQGVNAIAAPLPLTSLSDDVAALDRALERIEGPVVLSGHAYAGAVIDAYRRKRLTPARTVELLHDTIGEADLPDPDDNSASGLAELGLVP